ncbi:MAG: hypothetical protein JWO94_2585 [Verrucomicrobiaceae bacterium]|nr:hypothetical protein [Verrucomicrobiaceae bacterium]
MNPTYLETHFRAAASEEDWPAQFSILTAYATIGEEWPPEQNESADQTLEQHLWARGGFLPRIMGYSPKTGHSEPGWAVDMDWQEACDLGETFKQDAIYAVNGDELWVTYCEAPRRGLVRVGPFRERVTAG